MIFANFHIISSVLIFFCSLLFADDTLDLFWTNQIEDALNQRSIYFNNIGISDDGLRINSWEDSRKNQILSRLENNSSGGIWDNFSKGIILQSKGSPEANSLFRIAINSANNQPGSTWLLFFEFNRYRIFKWADICLEQLEKQLLSAGAISSTLISTQIRNIAISYEKEGNSQIASKMFEWSERFDPNQTWTIQKRFWIGFPGNMNNMRSAAISYWDIIKKSWIAQLALAESFYSLIRAFLFVLMLSIFITIGIKYYSSSIHYFADLYPLSVSASVRNLLALLIIISSFFFSIYLLLWVIAFLVWPQLNIKDKLLFSFALMVLILTPIDLRIIDLFQNAKNPEKALSIYKRASTEGYSEKFDNRLLVASNQHKSNALEFLASAINNYKKGDLESSQLSIEKALRLSPNDPVILVMSGNIFFQKGLFDKAKLFFEKAAKNDCDVSAMFNLAQCYVNQMDMVKGTELMDKAARINKSVVNAFIHQNDLLYQKNWPPLRSLMIPEYTPSYFWKHIFLTNNGSWETANLHWGTSFLGISLLSSFFGFCGLFFLLLFLSLFKSPIRIKKIFECKFCGRAICKKCANGILCSSCNQSTKFIKSDKKMDQIRLRIMKKNSLIHAITEIMADIFLPGTGSLSNSKNNFYHSVIVLFSTSIVYSLYIFIICMYKKYGYSIEMLIILILPIAYNLYFLIRRLGDLFNLISNTRN